MVHIWSVVRWWDDWQLRILVLGSLFLQWFLLLAAPMRKYTIPRILRTFIWLAYISSDALAIYALATLFNRHARANTAMSCDGIGGTRSKHSSSILEVLWAPILLIHLGGQEELAGYEIEDNELWTRHTVTLVSQVAVALYAFYKSWPSYGDWKLLAAAVLLFVIGVVSFSEKPLALNRAKIQRLASVSALIQGTKKSSKWRERLRHFLLFEESNCFTGQPPSSSDASEEAAASLSVSFTQLRRSLLSCWKKEVGSNPAKHVALTEGDKVLMVLSDMSLLAAARDLVDREKAKVEDVLPPLLIAQKALPRWLRSAFAFIYTRATVVVTPLYLLYHLLVVPTLHIAAVALFAMCDKQPYKLADVKITYIVLCLTAALDFFAVFIRQLLYRLMSMTQVPALCETVPGYNIINAFLQESDTGIGLIYRCARHVGFNCDQYFACKPELGELYKKVSATVITDLVNARDRDLASYRIFFTDHSAAGRREHPGGSSDSESCSNWALSKELQKHCGIEIKKCLGRVSFDRSVLLWHIATELCSRCTGEGENERGEGEEEVEGEQNEEHQQQQVEEIGGGGGQQQERRCEREQEVEEYQQQKEEVEVEEEEAEGGGQQQQGGGGEQEGVGEAALVPITRRRDPDLLLHMECTRAISNYMAHLLNFKPEMLLTGSREHLISEAMDEIKHFFSSEKDKMSNPDQLKKLVFDIADGKVPSNTQVFHTIQACKLAKELLEISESRRWMLMYRVWLGMLCYSASMCRGYLHAKSLGEGGEFLSFVWLVLSLKGAKTLADKLQMPPETQASDNAESK